MRAQLVPKAPPPAVDALLLTALALLWPGSGPPYAEHTLVDQAVAAARKRAGQRGFVNAVLRRFLREREALVAARCRTTRWRASTTRAGGSSACSATGPAQWQALLDANQQRPPMTLRVNARRGERRRLPARWLAAQAWPPRRAGRAGGRARAALPGAAAARLRRGRRVGAGRRRAARRAAAARRRACRPARACSTPAPRPAARRRTCWNWPTSTCWRSTATPQRLARVHDTLARLRPAGAHRWPPTPATPPPGGTAGRSTPSCSTRRAAPRASCAATPTCAGCAAPATSPPWRAPRRGCSTRCGRCCAPGGRLLYCTCSVFKAEGQDQIDAFLQRQRDASRRRRARRRPATCCRCPTMRAIARRPTSGASADGFFYACSTRPDLHPPHAQRGTLDRQPRPPRRRQRGRGRPAAWLASWRCGWRWLAPAAGADAAAPS